jgi:hypothetical protein
MVASSWGCHDGMDKECEGFTHHTKRLLIVRSGRNMSYDDQLQSASPRVLVLDYTHLGMCVKIVDTMFKLRISSGVCGNRKWNCKSIWQ